MQVIDKIQTIMVDVDGTLVTRKKPDDFTLPIEFNNYGVIEYLYPIAEHVNLIIKNKNKGCFIVVWSQNGHAWCVEVLTKLGLTDCVDLVMTKPSIYVDDLEFGDWCHRIFLG